MTIQDYVALLRRYWLVIIALAVLGGAAAFLYGRSLPAEYSSSAAVMVIPQRGDNTSDLVQGSNYVQGLVQTYAVLAASPLVLRPVIDELGLTETPTRLADRVTVGNPLNTQIIEISVADSDPLQAQKIAAAITTSLSGAVDDLSPKDSTGAAAVELATIAPARLPQAPTGPNTRLYDLMGLAAGLALGIAYALVRGLLGTRITERDDITSITDAPVIGEVVAWRPGESVATTMLVHKDGRSAESFRSLAANLKYVAVDRDLRVVMITSASPHEGKSSVGVGIAAALAESGHTVVLVDADLRRPSISRVTQLEGSVGLTSILIGDVAFDDAVQRWGATHVDILTGGTPAPNPGQLISSHRLQDVIVRARDEYEYVIIDSAPALTVSDALWLADLTDGVIVVARSGKTKRKQLVAVLTAIKSTRKDVVGIVLNAVKRTDRSPYYTEDLNRRRARPAKPSEASRLVSAGS